MHQEIIPQDCVHGFLFLSLRHNKVIRAPRTVLIGEFTASKSCQKSLNNMDSLMGKDIIPL